MRPHIRSLGRLVRAVDDVLLTISQYLDFSRVPSFSRVNRESHLRERVHRPKRDGELWGTAGPLGEWTKDISDSGFDGRVQRRIGDIDVETGKPPSAQTKRGRLNDPGFELTTRDRRILPFLDAGPFLSGNDGNDLASKSGVP